MHLPIGFFPPGGANCTNKYKIPGFSQSSVWMHKVPRTGTIAVSIVARKVKNHFIILPENFTFLTVFICTSALAGSCKSCNQCS